MKKLFIAWAILTISVPSKSQTCDERVDKLLQTMGSFSAATLYNTYAVIGSIGDGFGHDAYDAVTVNDLMDAQKKLADNLVKVFLDLKEQKIIQTQADIDYANTAITILNGLKIQAQLMEDYANTKKQQKLNEYDVQRKKNWSAISKLMGIPE